MQFKNLIISFFLLFVYSFGFAHSIMPHEHGFFGEHQPEASVKTSSNHDHAHHVCETPTESCIDHEDHCDDGLLDLIACVLNDLNSNHTDCDVEINPNENDKRIKINNSGSLSFIKSNFNAYISDASISEIELNNFYAYLFLDYSSPPIKNIPSRGPPCFS